MKHMLYLYYTRHLNWGVKVIKILNDFINLTQGQLLVKYWWLWLTIIIISLISLYWDNINYKIKSRKYVKGNNVYLPVNGSRIRVTHTGDKGDYKPIKASEFKKR